VNASPSVLERAIRRDTWIVGAGLVIMCALGWLYLYRAAAAMHAEAGEAAMHAAMGMDMPGMTGSIGAEFGALWLMWTVMMVAMMLPSATPVALLVLGTYRRRGDQPGHVRSVLFVAGYLFVWGLYSALAASAQVVMRRAALLSPDMMTSSQILAGGILVVAGIYQWLPIKDACLTHCRSPIDFLTRHWREGHGGALAMGARHGTVCVGCCWALMTLLFVAGVMNLLWVAAISVFVLLEKSLHTGRWTSRLAGVALCLWGIASLTGTLF
jgi:predicted metal-binding membrane protein